MGCCIREQNDLLRQGLTERHRAANVILPAKLTNFGGNFRNPLKIHTDSSLTAAS